MTITKTFNYYAFALFGITLVLLISCKKEDEPNVVKDIDGNVYKTVIIGDQEWFAENLKTTKYNNGTPIPNVTSNSDWSNLTSGAYAWYENNEATYKNAYGALYNWYAVNTGNLCPTGWHVPTDAEWSQLISHIDPSADPTEWSESEIAGSKLKSTRTAPDAHPRWESSNTVATDEYGFSALPGGSRYDVSGRFYDVGGYGFWWSSTEDGASYAWFRYMHFGNEYVARSNYSKKLGLSVRCIRDN
jgi:uncharacterized protein (TIGR02145 family)